MARSRSSPNGVSSRAPAVEMVTIRAPGRFNIEVRSASYRSRLPWAWSSSQIARSRIRPCWRGPSAAITFNQPPAVRISRLVVSTSGAISGCWAKPRAMSNRIAA
jgi:hypothetical protein